MISFIWAHAHPRSNPCGQEFAQQSDWSKSDHMTTRGAEGTPAPPKAGKEWERDEQNWGWEVGVNILMREGVRSGTERAATVRQERQRL